MRDLKITYETFNLYNPRMLEDRGIDVKVVFGNILEVCIQFLKALSIASFLLTYDMIYLLTAIGLSPGGSSTVHIYTKTIHRTTQNKQYVEQHNNLGKCGPCPILARFTLAFALQLRKKHGKTSVRYEGVPAIGNI